MYVYSVLEISRLHDLRKVPLGYENIFPFFFLFIFIKFNYCPLLRVRNRRNLNYNLNRFQERTQRIIYSDKCSTFSQLLQKENSVAILYKRNLQYFVI